MNDKKKPEIHARFSSSDDFRCYFEIVRTDGGVRRQVLEVLKQFEFAFLDEPREVEERAISVVDEAIAAGAIAHEEKARLSEEVRKEYNRVLGLHSW